MSQSRTESDLHAIAGPGPCVRSPWPIPGPGNPDDPLLAPGTNYIFPTWRAALADAQARIGGAYETRARLFRKAHEAGLSYREIGEATGLSAAAVGKILGKQRRATLDDQANA